MSERFRTTTPYQRAFDCVPRVCIGESVRRVRSARALRDYDATELTIEAGVDVHCICEESGWLLVQTEDGREGWIPASCVKSRTGEGEQ